MALVVTYWQFSLDVFPVELRGINFKCIDIMLWHLVFKFFPLKMYNKTIIGFGFCDMQNYQCLGKSYLLRLRLG